MKICFGGVLTIFCVLHARGQKADGKTLPDADSPSDDTFNSSGTPSIHHPPQANTFEAFLLARIPEQTDKLNSPLPPPSLHCNRQTAGAANPWPTNPTNPTAANLPSNLGIHMHIDAYRYSLNSHFQGAGDQNTAARYHGRSLFGSLILREPLSR